MKHIKVIRQIVQIATAKRIYTLIAIFCSFIFGIVAVVGSIPVPAVVAVGSSLTAGSVPEIALTAFVAGFGPQGPSSILVPFLPGLSRIAVTPSHILTSDNFHNTVTIHHLKSQKVLAILDVGSNPGQIVISKNNKIAYVLNKLSSSVSIISIDDLQVIKTITVGDLPASAALSANGDYLYITNNGSRSLSKIDTELNIVVATLPLNMPPINVVVTPNNQTIFVAGFSSPSDSLVEVIDSDSFSIITSIPVAAGPRGMTITPNGKKLYVASGGIWSGGLLVSAARSVTVIDVENRNVSTVLQVGAAPIGVAMSPNGKKIYVANNGKAEKNDMCSSTIRDLQTLSVIDVAKDEVITNDVPIDGPANGIAIYNNNIVYTTSDCNKLVSKVTVSKITNNLAESVSTIELPEYPISFAKNRNNENIYINSSEGNILKFGMKTAKVTATIPGRGTGPVKLAYYESGNKLIATLPGRNALAIIDIARKRVDEIIDVGINPSDIVIVNNYAYVGVYGNRRNSGEIVSIIDLTNFNVIGDVNVSFKPLVMEASAFNSSVWIGNTFVGLHYIDAFINTSATYVGINDNPFALAFTSSGSKLIAANDLVHTIDLAANNQAVLATNSSINRATDIDITSNNLLAFIVNNNSSRLVANPTLHLEISHNISVLDIAANSVTNTIEVNGPNPSKIRIIPGSDSAYVLNSGDRSKACAANGRQITAYCGTGNTISVINTSIQIQTGTISVGNKPIDIDLSPLSNKAYIANYFGNTVSVVNTSNNTVTATINVGKNPTDILVVENNNSAYVANQAGNTISFINLLNDTVTDEIAIR